jgi:hypothetical protein
VFKVPPDKPNPTFYRVVDDGLADAALKCPVAVAVRTEVESQLRAFNLFALPTWPLAGRGPRVGERQHGGLDAAYLASFRPVWLWFGSVQPLEQRQASSSSLTRSAVGAFRRHPPYYVCCS